MSNISHPAPNTCKCHLKLQLRFLNVLFSVWERSGLFKYNLLISQSFKVSCPPVPANCNLPFTTWLPRPLGIKIMVFISSATIISSQRPGLSYSGHLSREGKTSSNRLLTVCSTVARERIAMLRPNIYSKTLAKKLSAVNNYHIASARASLMQTRQSPLWGGKKSLHIAQLCAPLTAGRIQHPEDTCPISDTTSNGCT